jgi:histidinol-phosphatase (PHP family)
MEQPMIRYNNQQSEALPPFVSVHGGHSGEYCQHARDSLDDIVKAYHNQQFAWVGITEHIPPTSDSFLYPDERSAGLTASTMLERFAQYMAHCRSLQAAYSGELTIFVGMETEAYQGAVDYAIQLRDRFHPDYVVGSVHHVAGIPIDMNPSEYARAISSCGGIVDMYAAYFDLQYDMIHKLKPSVVGHFDLIRIFDPDYLSRLKTPDVWERICRNLKAVESLGLMLDLNVRALLKGAMEPYLCRPILEKVREMAIPVAPGDDSHGVDTVGRHVADGIRYLQSVGISTAWTMPGIYKH